MRKDKGLSGDLDRLPMLTWIMFLKFLDDMEQIAEQEAQMAGKRFRPALESPYQGLQSPHDRTAAQRCLRALHTNSYKPTIL